MERKKQKPLWIKKTTGTLILRKPRHMRLKHREKFRADPEELGRHIDDFELLEGDVDLQRFPGVGDEKQPPPAEEYTAEHVGGGWYNVLNPSGEVVNESKLRSDAAAELKNSLEGQQDG